MGSFPLPRLIAGGYTYQYAANIRLYPYHSVSVLYPYEFPILLWSVLSSSCFIIILNSQNNIDIRIWIPEKLSISYPCYSPWAIGPTWHGPQKWSQKKVPRFPWTNCQQIAYCHLSFYIYICSISILLYIYIYIHIYMYTIIHMCIYIHIYIILFYIYILLERVFFSITIQWYSTWLIPNWSLVFPAKLHILAEAA